MLRRFQSGRWIILITAMMLAVLACSPPLVALFPPTPTPTATPGLAPNFLTPGVGAAATPVATLPRSLPQPTPTVETTATPAFPYLTGEVRVYPGPLHYSGDLLTVEVVIKNIKKLGDLSATTLIVDSQASPLKVEPFLDQSPLRDDALVFRWAWDTKGVTGLHQLTAAFPIAGERGPQKVSTYVNLLPANARPTQEALAIWDVRNTACCRLRFITHTAAERDIFSLSDHANQAVLAVERKLGFPVSGKPVPLTFIDIEWGNGAYTSNEVVISHVDRDFTGIDLDTVLRHEITHWAMRPLGSRTPLILAEGTAVYVSGGHYKPEPLPERGAAVLNLKLYIPLAELADNFRGYQHEVAYIEAGSLVQYLTETYGWNKFLAVYGEEHLEGGDSQWLDQAFHLEYQKGLSQVETEYKTWLQLHPAGGQTDDVRMTIALFDTIRRYQEEYSPYQESLPNSEDAVNIGQTAEFMREATATENIALESALETAGQQLRASQYDQVQATLAAINAALDSGDFSQPPLADDLAIARVLADGGYEGQRVDLSGNTASVQAIRSWPRLETLSLVRADKGWQIKQGK